MRSWRSGLMGAAVVALLCTTPYAALAEGEVGRHITGAMSCADAGERFYLEDSAVQLERWPSRCTVAMEDPRVSGTMDSDVHMACFLYDFDRACMLYGEVSLAGPDGDWVGTMGAMNDASELGLPVWATMQGTGEYEGWTFWLFDPNALDESDTVAGMVYEGPPPPWDKVLPLTAVE